jgi:hypothetical protein
MTTVYVKILRTILYLCKLIGIININYILQPDGLLIKSTNLVYKCLEILRIIVLIIFSYYDYKHGDIIHVIQVFKVWTIIIASRISELQLIQ